MIVKQVVMMKPMSQEIIMGRDLKKNKTKLIENVTEFGEDGVTRKESGGFREDQQEKGSTVQGKIWGIPKEARTTKNGERGGNPLEARRSKQHREGISPDVRIREKAKMVKEGETLRKPGSQKTR